jgi:DNA uptake protein ComE-like DNA-binding protein
VDLNLADANALFATFVRAGLDLPVAAQLAVNLFDLVDADSNSTGLQPLGSAVTYWGLEPNPFIRQIGFVISAVDPTRLANNEFIVELYNPFTTPISLDGCLLALIGKKGGRAEVALSGTIGPSQYVTIRSKDPNNINLVLALYEQSSAGGFQIRQTYDIYLVRRQGRVQIPLDRQVTEDRWFDWNQVKGQPQYYARPDARWNIIYQQMYFVGQTPLPRTPRKRTDDPQTWDWVYARATRHNSNLVSPQQIWTSGRMGLLTVGQISRLLLIGPRVDDMASTLGEQLANEPDEASIRLDISRYPADAIFRYVRVLSGRQFNVPGGEGLPIRGRININTAGPYVLNRLPYLEWAGRRIGSDIGQAIVDYRNSNGAFSSIAQLLRVPQMQGMVGIAEQEDGGPDLTPDGIYDDLEARDLLFSRISNLITVRSDIFTAYILIRLGEDGPQRRLMAIFDRSQVKTASDMPRLILLHRVPDPR